MFSLLGCLCVSHTESGAILMLMMITMIIMITREKLVSIIAICCYNLSFLARHRPAEPCPLCSAQHNKICHWLYCKICYVDNPFFFVPIPPYAQLLFKARQLKARHCLLSHLCDKLLILNTSLQARRRNSAPLFCSFKK